MNAIEWYNYIARRNGGYRVNVPYEVVGESAEDVFEREVAELVRGRAALDAGCGHGEFTLRMAAGARRIVGYDFAGEMIAIAERLKAERGAANVAFLHTAHGQALPFPDGHFDVIYSRRGPGSIVEQARLLRPGGVITGIHAYPIGDGEIVDRIRATGDYEEPTMRVFDRAITYFYSAADYAEYLSSSHLAPDYTLPENRAAFEAILRGSIIGGRIGVRERKQIWRAVRKAPFNRESGEAAIG
ncbi:MAG: class I SAM-dependent methyltransferase [Clostridiales bacterium]|nr:class I SAM-dependent methyltransferase [Clostridiales bacterium]